jgi:hypothetical protein
LREVRFYVVTLSASKGEGLFLDCLLRRFEQRAEGGGI